MIFLDTANIEEIKQAAKLNVLKGVTTNPTILLKEKRSRKEIINNILALTTGEVFVQTHGEKAEDILQDSEQVLSMFNSEQIVLKIPAHFDGIEAIKRIKDKQPDVKILATVIYSVEQALLAAIAGSDYVAPYINRMENNDIDTFEVIKKIRTIYNDQEFDTKIMAASFKNTNQIIQMFYAGAHAATIPYDLLIGMANKGLVLPAIQKFNDDAASLENMTGDKNA